MNILVLFKAVPSVSAGLDGEQKTTELIVNPADLSALEEALVLKQTHGARVTVATMGIARCESLLKECVARGADEAVLITDKAFAGSDTCATSRILAEAVKQLGGFDLIFCGRRSTDGETGQVGPELAVRLGLPYIANCVDIVVDGSRLTATCLTDWGSETLAAPLPALITFRNGINSPRLPSLLGLRKAGKAQIRILDAAAIGLPKELTGQAGSPTIVKHSFRKEFRKRNAVRLDGCNLDRVIDTIRCNKEAFS